MPKHNPLTLRKNCTHLDSLVETLQNPHNYLSSFIISPASTNETKYACNIMKHKQMFILLKLLLFPNWFISIKFLLKFIKNQGYNSQERSKGYDICGRY